MPSSIVTLTNTVASITAGATEMVGFSAYSDSPRLVLVEGHFWHCNRVSGGIGIESKWLKCNIMEGCFRLHFLQVGFYRYCESYLVF